MLLVACKKDAAVRTSGTDTIDNIIHPSISYYAYGFSFSQAKLVATNSTPPPDITFLLNSDDIPTLQTNNFHPSFLKIRDFASESEAKAAFDYLKTVQDSQQWLDIASHIAEIAPNQVWVYRSDKEKYTKIRIVEINEKEEQEVAYVECKFQWVHQPDGSVNFP